MDPEATKKCLYKRKADDQGYLDHQLFDLKNKLFRKLKKFRIEEQKAISQNREQRILNLLKRFQK